MALRELLLPWDAQPQEAVEAAGWIPDWLWHAPMGRVLVPTASAATLTAYSGALTANSAGLALSHNGTSQLENWQFADWTPAFPVVIGGLFRVTETSTATQTAVGIGGSVLSSGLYGGVGQYTANRVSSWLRTGIAGADAPIDGPTAVAGSVYAVIRISRGVSDHVMFVNGVRYSTSTNTGGTSGAYRNISVGAAVRDTTPVLYGKQDVSLGFIGRTDPGDEWARSWTLNPWQLFEPRRIPVPVAAGGGSFEFTASGGLQLAGAAVSIFTGDFSFSAAGGLQLAGAAAASHTGDLVVTPSGGLQLAGAAGAVLEAGFDVVGSGGLQLAGAASTAFTGDLAFAASGGLQLAGAASSSYTGDLVFAPTGGVTFSGAAAASSESGYAVTGSGGLQLGGAAPSSSTGDFVFAPTGGLQLGGEAVAVATGDYAVTMAGGLQWAGSATSSLGGLAGDCPTVDDIAAAVWAYTNRRLTAGGNTDAADAVWAKVLS